MLFVVHSIGYCRCLSLSHHRISRHKYKLTLIVNIDHSVSCNEMFRIDYTACTIEKARREDH